MDRITRCRDMTIRVSWGHMEPTFSGGRGGHRGSAMAPLERAMVVSHRLSIVICDHCAICNHSAAICYRMSPTLKSTGGRSLWAQILQVFPLV